MVECKLRQKFLPARGGVAFLAALPEAAAVRIHVAVGAASELHARESCRTARGIRFVAFFAGSLDVKAGQRIAGFGVIELFRVFPVVYVVAAHAVFAELPFVNIFMATLALYGQTQIGLGEVLSLDQRPNVRADMRRCVALLACHSGVLPL